MTQLSIVVFWEISATFFRRFPDELYIHIKNNFPEVCRVNFINSNLNSLSFVYDVDSSKELCLSDNMDDLLSKSEGFIFLVFEWNQQMLIWLEHYCWKYMRDNRERKPVLLEAPSGYARLKVKLDAGNILLSNTNLHFLQNELNLSKFFDDNVSQPEVNLKRNAVSEFNVLGIH